MDKIHDLWGNLEDLKFTCTRLALSNKNMGTVPVIHLNLPQGFEIPNPTVDCDDLWCSVLDTSGCKNSTKLGNHFDSFINKVNKHRICVSQDFHFNGRKREIKKRRHVCGLQSAVYGSYYPLSGSVSINLLKQDVFY